MAKLTAMPLAEDRLDPAWHLLPVEQIARVLDQDMCDIDPEFLGFTDIYIALASIIPTHWTVVDLGCAYAPQAFVFKSHKAYIGVDPSRCERFAAPNTTHYRMTTVEFIEAHGETFDKDRTFAICSYVPRWFRQDSLRLTRKTFRNVFTYYPASNPDEPSFFTTRAALDAEGER